MILVTGAEAIALVAEEIRTVGSDRKIVNDMAREIRQSLPTIRTAIRANAVEYLPSGLAPWVNQARITMNVRRSAKSAGVTVRSGRNSRGGRTDMKAINAGRVRHLSWGHRPWSPQTVRAGFFDDAITEEGADQLRDAVITAADNAARRILDA